jgi:hypothetical protein
MKPLSGLSRWRSVAALVAALVLLQALVLDRTEEKREEDAASRIDALPPGDLLATYISSLFLGSFRAIVVDMIWIELRQADAEKRVYRQKELLEWLAILQPRNEEVRQLLSWDIAFNIAETVNPRDRWQWEKTGILSILKGCSDLPHSIYLKWEVAQTHLYKKSFPIDGEFNHRFIEHLTNDRELQDLLQEKPGQPAQSPFELAIRWMTLARDQLRREHGSRTRTQVGRILDVYWADGLIRDFTYLEAMLRRGRGDYDGARMWLRKAEGLTLAMIRDHFPDSLHRVTAAKSARRLRRLTPILPEATLRRALESRLRRLEWVELEPWVRWLHVRGDQRVLYVKASEIKRELSGDPFEINDREFDVTHLAIDPNAPVTANIFPPGDRDLYRITLDLSRGHPSAILVVAIEPNRPGFPLRVRATAHLSNGSTRDLGEAQAPILIEHPIVVSQAVDLQVTAPGASPVDPEESTYRIRVGLRPLDR